MKKVILSLSILFISILAIAQNQATDTSATCVAYWRKGETKVFTITRSKEKLQQGKPVSKSVASYEAQLKVVDSTKEGYTLEWTHKNYHVEGVAPHVFEFTNNVMQGLKMVYKTNDVGSFAELVNWQEVRDFYIKLMEASVKKEDEVAVAAAEQVKKMFQNKESIETVLIREIQLYHMPFGVEYSTSGQIAAMLLPNIAGGEPFPATMTLTLTGLEVPKDKCRITALQALDKSKGRDLLIDMLGRMFPGHIDDAEMQKAITDLEMTDKNEFELTLSTGWLSKASVKRVVTIGETTQIETYRILEKTP